MLNFSFKKDKKFGDLKLKLQLVDPSYNRPEPSVYRGYRREGRGNEYAYRDYHVQREHQYEDHSQKSIHHTPNFGRSLNDWRQRKFYGSGRSAQPDGFSRQNSDGLYRNDQPPMDYYRGNSEPGGPRYSRPVSDESFRKREEMENDYNKLLQYYAEVQAELQQIGQHSPSPHTDNGADLGAGADAKSARGKIQRTPSMTMAEAVSDVSSDEMSFSQEQKLGDDVESSSVKADCKADDSNCDELQVDEASAAPPASTAKVQPQVEEEDDLDVLELRRIALESAALRKHRQLNESDLPPDGSQSSSSVTTDSKSHAVRNKNVLEVFQELALELTTDNSDSAPKGTAASDGSQVKHGNKGHESKGHTDKPTSSSHSKHSVEPSRSLSANHVCSNKKEGSREDRHNDSKSSPEQTKRSRSREKENSSKSGSRKGKSDRESSVRARPLPFAPTRIETIRLKSISTRSSSLTDAAKRVQRRARQTSVARQLPPSKHNTTSSATSSRHGHLRKSSERECSHPHKSADHKSSKDRERSGHGKSAQLDRGSEEEKKLEERRREMNGILSLPDQKEQVIRFLKLISYEGAGAVTSSSSTSSFSPKTKVPTTTDNYEEVEMDIDSGDDLEDILRKNDFQIAAPLAPPIGPEAMLLTPGSDTMMAAPLISWPLPTPTHYAPMCQPPASIPFALPPLPPLQPLLPPLPPPMEEPLPPPFLPYPQRSLPPPSPPPPPPGVEEVAEFCSGAMNDDARRISKLAQFFQAAVAKQESVQKTATATVAAAATPPQLAAAVSTTPEQTAPESSGMMSPVAQRSSEDAPSEHGSSSPYSPTKCLGAGLGAGSLSLRSEDLDEEDEALMREKLLRSLLIRRKEKAEGKAASTSSKESSPTASGTASPQPPALPKAVSRNVHTVTKPPAFYRRMEFPVHKPVVVSLNETSSEDEDGGELAGREAAVSCLDIDSFLKAQRKSAEVQGRTQAGSVSSTGVIQTPVGHVKESQLQQQQQREQQHHRMLQEQGALKQKETHLSSFKRLLLMDELKLKTLASKFSHVMNEKKMADTRVAHLKKQLAVAEKMAANQAHLVISHREQAKQMKESVQKKREIIQTATEEALNLGRQLMGPTYVLGSCPNPHAHILKRKAPAAKVSVTFQPSNSKRQRPDADPWPSLAVNQGVGVGLAEDRHSRYARLQQQKAALEQEIQMQRLKLQQYKKSSVSATPATPVQGGQSSVAENQEKLEPQEAPEQKHHCHTSDNSRASKGERLPSLETIKLDPLEDVAALSVKHSHRRRSLLDMDQSPKPTLILRDRNSPQEGAQGHGQGSEEGSKKGRVGEDFRMPSGSQLNNLCRIQREKMDKVLSTAVYQPLKVFSNLGAPCCPIAQLRTVLPGSGQRNKTESEGESAHFAYTSPLLMFRAYRFSSYYRTREGLTLTSPSFAHKVNPNRVMCRYDMKGTCNDQHCTWQHEADNKLTDREILMDLVSYCPALAGVKPDTPLPDHPTLIGEYVDNLLTHHKGKMTIDDLCLLLTAKVNDAANHGRPHTMFYDRRPWRPCASESTTFSLSVASQFQTPDHTLNGVGRCGGREADSVVDVDDVRYFAAGGAGDKGGGEGGGEGQDVDMEGAVMATPHDVLLWLRLAYSKLSSPAR
ncbi:hypothetical protein ACOMHN_020109 [Nucella lapillus]